MINHVLELGAGLGCGIGRAGSALLCAAVMLGGAMPAMARENHKPALVVVPPSRGKPKVSAPAPEPARLARPIVGGRMTSPFGWRIHPVLGVRKFHRGVDFAAPRGTPVLAAADGVVEYFGWRGHYGKYIRVRHSGHNETAYAHMASFAPGLQVSGRVHRGQVIGYVGTTGYATGPHLYFEVLVDHQQVNPLAPRWLDLDGGGDDDADAQG